MTLVENSEAIEMFRKFKERVKKETKQHIKFLQTNHGGE